MYLTYEAGVRTVRSPSEDYLHRLREIFDDVSIPIYDDSTILMFIEEGIAAFLDGTITAEEIARDIEQRAFLYLNE